jgi:hypothetical protein
VAGAPPAGPNGPSCSLASVRIGPALTAAPSEDTITQVLRMPGYLGIYQEELMGYAPRHDALPLPEYDRIPAADTATSRHAATPVSCGGHVALPRYGSNVTAPEQPFDASAIKESPRNRSDSGIPSRAPYPDKTYRKVSSRGAASSKIRAPDYASPPRPASGPDAVQRRQPAQRRNGPERPGHPTESPAGSLTPCTNPAAGMPWVPD